MFKGLTTTQLTEALNDWLTKNGLPHYSADELLHEELTDAQRSWITDFIIAWEDQQRSEDRARPKNAVSFVVTLRSNGVVEDGEAIRQQIEAALELHRDEVGFDGPAFLIEVKNTFLHTEPLCAADADYLSSVDKAAF
jgi:hypothetical protein